MIHFISDLHLSSQTPGITRRFLHYLGHQAREAEQIFILGDLFEAWPGDDCIDDPDDDFNGRIVHALRCRSDRGVGLSVMHGNRDFLLGEDFATRCGAHLLPDPFELSISSHEFVLSHGDALCTDDSDYQAFRAKVRHPAFRTAVLARTLAERKVTAAALRAQSEQAKEGKNKLGNHLADLNAKAIENLFREHRYATFIHGHTHRPATHDHLVDGIPIQRWVLADWHEDRGEFLCFDGKQFHRHAL